VFKEDENKRFVVVRNYKKEEKQAMVSAFYNMATKKGQEYLDAEAIVSENKALRQFLTSVGDEHWTREKSIVQMGNMTNNVSGSFNNMINKMRWRPTPFSFYKDMITFIKELFDIKTAEALFRTTPFPKKITCTLKRNFESTHYWAVEDENEGDEKGQFTIKEMKKNEEVETPYKVEICRKENNENITCTCGFPQEYGYPCVHCCAVFKKLEISLEGCAAYASPFRLMTRQRETYANCSILEPDPTSLLADDTIRKKELAARSGRKRKARIPSCFEEGTTDRFHARKTRYSCRYTLTKNGGVTKTTKRIRSSTKRRTRRTRRKLMFK
jgi:hypothetical protein